MERLSSKTHAKRIFPERVLQFGEGNFLRGFADWQIQILNEKKGFNGSAVVVQPRGSSKIERLNRQDGLYTLYLEGLKEGVPVKEHMVIDSISRGINLQTDYEEFIRLAGQKELRFIISNATEAGMVFDPDDRLEDRPQKGFTGKLAGFLYHRYLAFKGDEKYGCIILPCELVEENGGKLKGIILQYADSWNLSEDFKSWIDHANVFCSTLVDRIVPGFPKDSLEEKTEELGYEDELLVTGEHYHLWAIEGPSWLKDELPAEGTGLNLVITDDITPFRTRKVRILNGAHTAMTPLALLSGLETVEESVKHPEVGLFIKKLIEEEILPALDGDRKELEQYAEEVMNRFANPYIKHYLKSISLNSVSKFSARNLPALLDYIKEEGKLPAKIVFSLCCLLYLYKKMDVEDSSTVLEILQSEWRSFEKKQIGIEQLSANFLKEQKLWGRDLTGIAGLKEAVAGYLREIEETGIEKALQRVIDKPVLARGELE
ncbi:tagaturonate reductase [Bacillus infantis]|uniref:tagaturonate reductase n=1 Tax=Bacillus infantis TaxID=324767 RepID=UPI0030193C86